MGKNITIVLVLIVVISLVYFFVFPSHKIITQNTATSQKFSFTKFSKKGSNMTISSPVFANNGTIPTNNTCDGKGVNPSLTFGNVPSNTKSLVMLMDDPDAPSGTFAHWIIYNIDPTVTEIAENSTPPGIQGLNGIGKIGYTPPCPLDREHQYFFKLYALDTRLEFENPAKVTKGMVIGKMQGYIIEQTELIGRYNRPQNQK